MGEYPRLENWVLMRGPPSTQMPRDAPYGGCWLLPRARSLLRDGLPCCLMLRRHVRRVACCAASCWLRCVPAVYGVRCSLLLLAVLRWPALLSSPRSRPVSVSFAPACHAPAYCLPAPAICLRSPACYPLPAMPATDSTVIHSVTTLHRSRSLTLRLSPASSLRSLLALSRSSVALAALLCGIPH